MEILPDCLPCMLRQALSAARKASSDERKVENVCRNAAYILANSDKCSCAPQLCRLIHREVKNITGCDDPYLEDKFREIRLAQENLPILKSYVENSPQPLEAAVRAAALGNIIDAGAGSSFRPEKLEEELKVPFQRFQIDEFKESLSKAETVLYIGDNSGEAVFDCLLLEKLGDKKIYFAVRGEAILNDVTESTAQLAGVGNYAEIVSAGSGSPGCIISECGKEFKELFNKADMVIAKGQGNFEALSGSEREIFFLLKAKCPAIAGRLGVDILSYVLKT